MFFLKALPYAVGITFFFLFGSILLFLPYGDFLKELLSEEFLYALRLTIFTALVSTAVVMSVSIPTAYGLARSDFPLKGLIKVLIDLPMFFPELLMGLLLLLFFSNLLKVQIAFTTAAVVLAEIFVSLPFAVKILYTTFVGIDKRYELVARSLGYKPIEVFFKVVLPMAKDGLLAALVVAFARSFGAFGAVLIFAGGVYMKTETLPVGIFLNISYGNIERASLMGFLLMVVSFLTLFTFERLTSRRG